MGEGCRVKGERDVQYLTHDPIDVEKRHRDSFGPEVGASVEFLGTVRRQEDGRDIEVLEYEAYDAMAEAVIERLIQQAQRRWPLHRVEVRHRTGRVFAGEIAVRVRVQAPHREEAFEACRFLIDRIKEEAPIWKRPMEV